MNFHSSHRTSGLAMMSAPMMAILVYTQNGSVGLAKWKTAGFPSSAISHARRAGRVRKTKYVFTK